MAAAVPAWSGEEVRRVTAAELLDILLNQLDHEHLGPGARRTLEAYRAACERDAVEQEEPWRLGSNLEVQES